MFFGVAELSEAQTQSLVRGMYMLAASDGVHANEMALIEAFYKDSLDGNYTNGTEKSFGDLIKEDFNVKNAKKVFDTVELREGFMRTTLFLSLADGKLSDEEKKVLKQLASDFDVSDERFVELHTDTVDVFMQQFVDIKNNEKLAEISAALSL